MSYRLRTKRMLRLPVGCQYTSSATCYTSSTDLVPRLLRHRGNSVTHLVVVCPTRSLLSWLPTLPISHDNTTSTTMSYYIGVDVYALFTLSLSTIHQLTPPPNSGTGSARAALVSSTGDVVAESTYNSTLWRDEKDANIFEQSSGESTSSSPSPTAPPLECALTRAVRHARSSSPPPLLLSNSSRNSLEQHRKSLSRCFERIGNQKGTRERNRFRCYLFFGD